MNKTAARDIAIRTARSEMRAQGWTPSEMTADNALLVLDDLARSEPDLVASKWWAAATPNQVKLLKREWTV